MRIYFILILPFVVVLTLSAQEKPNSYDAQYQVNSDSRNVTSKLDSESLAGDPNNIAELSDLVDRKETQGDWKSAVSPLEQLVNLEPTNAKRIHQLGLWESWSQNPNGLDRLKRACELEPVNSQYCTDYAEVLSWRKDRASEAISQLHSVLDRSPDYVPAVAKLAEILSRDTMTRDESYKLFADAVKRDPDNVNLLNSFAAALSYDRRHFKEATDVYRKAVELDPSNTESLVGEAQLIAYSGRTKEAIELYDRVLEKNPTNAAALRGKAEILNWKADFKSSNSLLQRARAIAPEDPKISAEIVRSEIGMFELSDVRNIANTLPAQSQFDEIREEVQRATGRWMEMGYGLRRNANNLEYDQLTMSSSMMLGPKNRIITSYTPRYASSSGTSFNDNYYAAEIDSHLGRDVAISAKAGAMTFPGFSTELNGAFQLLYQNSHSTRFQLGFDRSPVDDTLLSFRGVNTAGLVRGQVTSNLVNLGVAFTSLKHGLDGSINYSDGIYSGISLDRNRRWTANGNLGKQVAESPYIRLAYGFSFTQFEYDAQASGALPSRSGGYFSPNRYLLNYAGASLSHRFSKIIRIEASGTTGAQNVESSTSSFQRPLFAGNFSGSVLIRASAKDEIRLGYEYQNVFNAFQRNLGRISWRHYF